MPPRPAPTPPRAPHADAVLAASPYAPPYAATGEKLGWAVLAYLAAAVLVITLQPFDFRVPHAVRVMYWAPDSPWYGWFDVIANVALFVPLGFVAALARSARRTPDTGAPSGRALGWALALGVAVSAGIEITQCFEPGRYPSPTDVLSNAVGAALGAWLHARAAGRLRADSPLVGRLALELPVTGLVYVMLPLLTLAALTAGGGAAVAVTLGGVRLVIAPRALGVLALAGFGGVLLGTLQRRQLGPAGALAPRAMAAVAVAWLAAGALPAAVTAPRAYAAGALLAGAAAWGLGRRALSGVRSIERRFEGEALGRGAPWLAAYLLLLPLGDRAHAPWSRLSILRDLEGAAAFAVLGYVLAEAWGRREWRYRHAAWRVTLAAGGAAAVLAVVAAASGETAPGWAAVLARAASAGYGGWIYHLQRAHVRALVAARRPAAAPDARATAARAA